MKLHDMSPRSVLATQPAIPPTREHVAVRANWAEKILRPCNALKTFSAFLLLVYVAIPLVIHFTILPDRNLLSLAAIAGVGTFFMWVGQRLPLFDYRFKAGARRLTIGWRVFVGLTCVTFVIFTGVTLSTAPSIPLLSALRGADSDMLSAERGAFLKGRQGYELALLYISTFLLNTIVPYSLVTLYSTRAKIRHLFGAFVLLFSISFLQKTLFLNLALPLLAYYAMRGELQGRKAAAGIFGSLLIIIVSTYLSAADAIRGAGTRFVATDFMSAKYAPESPLAYLVWRAISVPIFTATDTLIVHAQTFNGRWLLGSTSTLISALFGMERVNLERYVFEYQFGGWNDTANANSLFLVDAYVNFSWFGVILFGFFVGQVFRWFCRSTDEAFQSMWTLLAFVLFSASLIGMMLSNGWLFMLLFALFVRVRRPGSSEHGPQGGRPKHGGVPARRSRRGRVY